MKKLMPTLLLISSGALLGSCAVSTTSYTPGYGTSTAVVGVGYPAYPTYYTGYTGYGYYQPRYRYGTGVYYGGQRNYYRTGVYSGQRSYYRTGVYGRHWSRW